MAEKFVVEIDADVSGYRQKMAAAGRSVEGLDAKFDAASGAAGKFERSASATGTAAGRTGTAVGGLTSKFASIAGPAALAAAGIAAATAAARAAVQVVKAAANAYSTFEAALNKLKVVGVEAEAAQRDLIAVAQETGAPITELAEGYYQAVSAMDDTSRAQEVLKAAWEVSQATGASVADTVKTMAVSMNNFGDEIKDAKQIGDQLIAFERNAIATTGEYSTEQAKFNAVMSNAGVSFEETSAFFAAITKSGEPAAEAATKLKALGLAFQSLEDPSSKMRIAFAENNIAVDENTASSGELIDKLVLLRDAYAGQSEKLKTVLGSEEAYLAFLEATKNNGDRVKTTLEGINEAQGETKRLADASAGSLVGLQSRFKNISNTVLTQVGDLLAPALEAGYANLVEAFTELSQWISENENDLRAWATVFGEVVNTAFTYIRGFIDAVLLPFKTLFNALQGIGAFLGVVDADAGEAFKRIGEDFKGAAQNAVDFGKAVGDTSKVVGDALSGEAAARSALKTAKEEETTEVQSFTAEVKSHVVQQRNAAAAEKTVTGELIANRADLVVKEKSALTAAVDTRKATTAALKKAEDTRLEQVETTIEKDASNIISLDSINAGRIEVENKGIAAATTAVENIKAADTSRKNAETNVVSGLKTFTGETKTAAADQAAANALAKAAAAARQAALEADLAAEKSRIQRVSSAMGTLVDGLDTLAETFGSDAFGGLGETITKVADNFASLSDSLADGEFTFSDFLSSLNVLAATIGGQFGAGIQGGLGGFQAAAGIVDTLDISGGFGTALKVAGGVAGGLFGLLGFGEDEVAVEVESEIVKGFQRAGGRISSILGGAIEDGLTGADASAGIETFLNNMVRSNLLDAVVERTFGAEGEVGTILDTIGRDVDVLLDKIEQARENDPLGGLFGFSEEDQAAIDAATAHLENQIGIAGNLGTVVANSLDGVFDLFVEDAEDAGEAAGAAAAVAVNETFDANVKVESAIVGTFKGTAPQIGGIIGQSVEQGMTGADAAAGVEKFVNNLIKSTISAEIGTALLQPILAEAGAGVDAYWRHNKVSRMSRQTLRIMTTAAHCIRRWFSRTLRFRI